MEIVNGTEITYLYAQGQPFAIHKKNVNETNCINYLHLDYQGSLMAITSQSGNIIEERNYDVWGRPRNPNTLEYVLPNPFGSGSPVKRGFTFHEHLEEFNLINMNGRMYDPLLARFLNADPLLQDNTDAQNYNRYSYVLNNPTKYTDPSGYAIQGAGTNYGAPNIIQGLNSAEESNQNYLDLKRSISRSYEDIFGRVFGGGGGTSPNEYLNDDGGSKKLNDAEKAEYVAKYGKPAPNYEYSHNPVSGIDKGKVSEFCGNAGDAAHWGGLYVGSINKFAANSANQFGYISGPRNLDKLGNVIFPTEIAGSKVLGNISKYTKIGGYGIGVIGGLTAIGEFAYSKKENADYAKLVVAAYIIGVNFVPVVGPVISIGLGTLDAMGYFDSYYYSFNYYNQPRK
jgi:RHS repeat-associated protein